MRQSNLRCMLVTASHWPTISATICSFSWSSSLSILHSHLNLQMRYADSETAIVYSLLHPTSFLLLLSRRSASPHPSTWPKVGVLHWGMPQSSIFPYQRWSEFYQCDPLCQPITLSWWNSAEVGSCSRSSCLNCNTSMYTCQQPIIMKSPHKGSLGEGWGALQCLVSIRSEGPSSRRLTQVWKIWESCVIIDCKDGKESVFSCKWEDGDTVVERLRWKLKALSLSCLFGCVKWHMMQLKNFCVSQNYAKHCNGCSDSKSKRKSTDQKNPLADQHWVVLIRTCGAQTRAPVAHHWSLVSSQISYSSLWVPHMAR